MKEWLEHPDVVKAIKAVSPVAAPGPPRNLPEVSKVFCASGVYYCVSLGGWIVYTAPRPEAKP